MENAGTNRKCEEERNGESVEERGLQLWRDIFIKGKENLNIKDFGDWIHGLEHRVNGKEVDISGVRKDDFKNKI